MYRLTQCWYDDWNTDISAPIYYDLLSIEWSQFLVLKCYGSVKMISYWLQSSCEHCIYIKRICLVYHSTLHEVLYKQMCLVDLNTINEMYMYNFLKANTDHEFWK